MAAVAFRYQCADLLGGWLDCYDRFARAHEMLDDFCDWHEDLAGGRSSFLLSEAARRKRPEETLHAYMLRKGLAIGYAKMETWLCEASDIARGLHSELLNQFLEYRRDQVQRFWNSFAPSLQRLKELADVLEGHSHGAG